MLKAIRNFIDQNPGHSAINVNDAATCPQASGNKIAKECVGQAPDLTQVVATAPAVDPVLLAKRQEAQDRCPVNAVHYRGTIFPCGCLQYSFSYELGTVEEGGLIWKDRPYTFDNVPDYLLGKHFIMQEHARIQDDPVIKINPGVDGSIYLIAEIGRRDGGTTAIMAREHYWTTWVGRWYSEEAQGFSYLKNNILDGRFKVYRRDVTADQILDLRVKIDGLWIGAFVLDFGC